MDELAVARAVGLAHGAVSRPALWADAACALAEAMGASTAAWGFRHADGRESGGVCPNTDPEWHRRYAEEFAGQNHVWAAAAAAPAGSVIVAESLGGVDAWRRSGLYRGFVRPQGFDSVLTLSLVKGPDRSALMSFGRRLDHDGFSAQDAAQAARLGALIAGAARAASRAGARMFANQLERVGGATFLCDAACRVLERGEATESYLDSGLARIDGGHRLSIRSAPGFAKAVAAAARPHSGWPAPMGCDLRADDGVVIRVAPWCGPVGGWAELDPLAVVILDRQRRQHVPSRFAATHRLTAREAAIAAGLWRGLTLSQVASVEGIALSTARTHLQHIFDKTGARTQNALLAVMEPGSWPEPPQA